MLYCKRPGNVLCLRIQKARSMTPLHIRLFGAIEIRRDGEPLTDFRSEKALVLLAYLVSEDQPVTRDFLAGLGWPDVGQSQALGLLRRSLHDLNGRLPGCLAMDRRTVRFRVDAPVDVDLRHFARLLAQDGVEAWEEAVALYRAPFLHGVYVDDAPELERWLLQEREHWQQALILALDRLVGHYAKCTAYPQALGYARQLLKLEPWREETHRQVMLLLARTGQVSAALAQYATCRQTLWDELAVEPALETETLCARIRGMSTLPALNLPAALTPFVGRCAEREQLTHLLADPNYRLITVVGVGGVGKTRLALETVREIVNGTTRLFLHGGFYVPLAAVGSLEQLVLAVCQALPFSFQPHGDPTAQLTHYLHDKEILLLLDNFEHLIDRASLAFLGALLDHAPGVTLLVTSRARLHLHGEQIYRLQGLHFPGALRAKQALTADEALTYGGIQLLVNSARRIHLDYTPPLADIPALVAICQSVQGTPLALELAMAWLDQHTPAAIAVELAQNVDFLSHAALNIPPRQRSMRAVFQTCWRLLAPDQQRVLAALTVFQGGFSAELAMAVGDATERQLAALVDKSLVHISPQGRYDLHELTRQFAAEQLAHLGQGEALHRRHACAILRYIRGAAPAEPHSQAQARLQAAVREHENIQAALRWSFATGEHTLGLELLVALGHFWYMHNFWHEGRRWLEQATALSPLQTPPALRAALLNQLGVLLYSMDEYLPARRAHEESLRIFQTLADERESAWTLYHLAQTRLHNGDSAKAKALATESLLRFRKLGDLHGTAQALARLAALLSDDGQELARAEALLLEGLALARQINAVGTIVGLLILLGGVAGQQGDPVRAERFLRESLTLPMKKGARSWALGKLGNVLLAQGKVEEATHCFQEALALRQELGNIDGVAWMLEAQADVAIHTGDFACAAQFLAAAALLRKNIGVHLSAFETRQYEKKVMLTREQLGDKPFRQAWRAGQQRARVRSDFTNFLQSESEAAPLTT
jgi:predicted ATPase/DNA-binding SARP family transcriptional activator